MEFEWDDSKAEANEAKHGVAFAYASRVFFDRSTLVLDTSRVADREDREKAIGLIEGKLFTVIFTMRRDVCRIISARRANDREEKAYGHHSL